MIKLKHYIISIVLIYLHSVVADSNNYNYFKYGYHLLYDQ